MFNMSTDLTLGSFYFRKLTLPLQLHKTQHLLSNVHTSLRSKPLGGRSQADEPHCPTMAALARSLLYVTLIHVRPLRLAT